jgi:hypothetical protein
MCNQFVRIENILSPKMENSIPRAETMKVKGTMGNLSKFMNKKVDVTLTLKNKKYLSNIRIDIPIPYYNEWVDYITLLKSTLTGDFKKISI